MMTHVRFSRIFYTSWHYSFPTFLKSENDFRWPWITSIHELSSLFEYTLVFSFSPYHLISLLTARAVLGADLIDAVQGTPMAIEDAVQLASSLLHHNGISDEALSHYVTVRKERVIPIWQESTKKAVAYYKLRDAEQNPMKVTKDESGKNMFEFIQSYDPPKLSLQPTAKVGARRVHTMIVEVLVMALVTGLFRRLKVPKS
jgi:hypothetical protein